MNVDRDYAYINFATLSKFFDPTLAVAEADPALPRIPRGGAAHLRRQTQTAAGGRADEDRRRRPARPSHGRCSESGTLTASRRTRTRLRQPHARRRGAVSTAGSTPPKTASSCAAGASATTSCRPWRSSRRTEFPAAQAEAPTRLPRARDHAYGVRRVPGGRAVIAAASAACCSRATHPDFVGHAGRGDGPGRLFRLAPDAEPPRRARLHLRRGLGDGQLRTRRLFRHSGPGRRRRDAGGSAGDLRARSNASARSRCRKRNWSW